MQTPIDYSTAKRGLGLLDDHVGAGVAVMDPVDPRADVLLEAAACVLSDRTSVYGLPEDNFANIAIFWNAYFDVRKASRRASEPLDSVDVAELMDLMKHGRRTINREHKDSWVDGIGYNACGWRSVVKLEEQPELDLEAARDARVTAHDDGDYYTDADWDQADEEVGAAHEPLTLTDEDLVRRFANAVVSARRLGDDGSDDLAKRSWVVSAAQALHHRMPNLAEVHIKGTSLGTEVNMYGLPRNILAAARADVSYAAPSEEYHITLTETPPKPYQPSWECPF